MVTVKRDNAPVPKFITESFNYIKEKGFTFVVILFIYLFIIINNYCSS